MTWRLLIEYWRIHRKPKLNNLNRNTVSQWWHPWRKKWNGLQKTLRSYRMMNNKRSFSKRSRASFRRFLSSHWSLRRRILESSSWRRRRRRWRRREINTRRRARERGRKQREAELRVELGAKRRQQRERRWHQHRQQDLWRRCRQRGSLWSQLHLLRL